MYTKYSFILKYVGPGTGPDRDGGNPGPVPAGTKFRSWSTTGCKMYASLIYVVYHYSRVSAEGGLCMAPIVIKLVIYFTVTKMVSKFTESMDMH